FVGGKPSFLWAPLRRQVFVVISICNRRQGGRDSPGLIDPGRHQEQDQKVGEPSHLRGRLLLKATPTQCPHATYPMDDRQSGQKISGSPCGAPVLMGRSLYFLSLPQGQGDVAEMLLAGHGLRPSS